MSGETTGIMRLVTATEVAANAATRWRGQYSHWNDDDAFADGKTKREINDALNNCRHTPENIARVLNDGWARPECVACGEHHDAVVEIMDAWGESRRSYCNACLSRALDIITGPHT